jgi:hypothetical protein
MEYTRYFIFFWVHAYMQKMTKKYWTPHSSNPNLCSVFLPASSGHGDFVRCPDKDDESMANGYST